jgi:signal transduction histidine kinase
VSQIVYLASPLPDTQWQALPEGVRWQFVGLLLFAVALVSGAGLLLARRISRPLAKLADAAHGVAGGDLAQTVPEDAAIIELSVLGRAFNAMTASLRQSDQAKTAFISDVSHELRTPLTVIKGSIETLQDGALDDLEMRGQFLNSMNLETERLIRLVNDLLVLTRADAGALNLHLQTVDLGELARSRCERLAHTAELRQVRLLPSFEAEPYPVRADADRLAQVLDNLLDNAIRYSPPGGEVKLILKQEADRVVCQVADCGVGIPANHLPFIFERFYRVESARERNVSDGNTSQVGSGLGLAIVRSLVTAHGGDVSVTSSEGKGTTFSFWLPADNNP